MIGPVFAQIVVDDGTHPPPIIFDLSLPKVACGCCKLLLWDAQNILWIPPEFRPLCSAFQGNLF
jgi:hypothetical protein